MFTLCLDETVNSLSARRNTYYSKKKVKRRAFSSHRVSYFSLASSRNNESSAGPQFRPGNSVLDRLRATRPEHLNTDELWRGTWQETERLGEDEMEQNRLGWAATPRRNDLRRGKRRVGTVIVLYVGLRAVAVTPETSPRNERIVWATHKSKRMRMRKKRRRVVAKGGRVG